MGIHIRARLGWQGIQCLIGLQSHPESSVFRTMVVELRHGHLHIREFNEWADLEACRKYLTRWPAVPIVWVPELELPLEAVIHTETEPLAQLLGAPPQQPASFVWQRWPAAGSSYATLARREALLQAQEALGPVVNSRFFRISLLKCIQALLIPSIPDYSPQNPYLLEGTFAWRDGLLDAIPDSCQPVTHAELSEAIGIPTEFLKLYAGLVHSFQQAPADTFGWPCPWSEQEIEQRKREIRIGLIAGGVFAGIWLLASSIQLAGTYRHAGQLAELAAHQSVLDSLSEYDRHVESAGQLLGQLTGNQLKASACAWRIDQLMLDIPHEIHLQELTYPPAPAPNSPTSADLVMQGTTSHTGALATYAQSLRKLPFVHAAQIRSGTFDFAQQTHPFTLQIEFVDE
ncbi:hypothetical protein [Pontibacter sp. G13]|uniref:hypothetical protein n=1 Tax=Pontibacter sp. G13 TaxID=3074898 RepID=UPI002889DD62|nr:hypothetical protein [Pontibacter sp. G13]WNJ21614.1 hypothetical protein RJD25_28855 [Pontibacter sp. G13]